MRGGPRLLLWVAGMALPPLCGAAEGTAAPGKAVSTSCVVCHAGLDGPQAEPADAWASDVHHAAGLGCESCHGGDPSPALGEEADAAMSPAKGFRPPPTRLQVADFCARCHADPVTMKRHNPQMRVDQLAEYRSSVHGRLNARGDPAPATCTDCHGAHGIRPASSPDAPVYATNVPKTCARCHADAKLMAPYGIPTSQYGDYLRSAHATALIDRDDTAAPACNDCHGNHGAVPPGVSSVAHVCGQCHGREAVLFGGSFKKDLFQQMEIGECTACHDPHRTRHPTPELFHGGSAPRVTAGKMVSADPFAAEMGGIEAGGKGEAVWMAAIRPRVADADPRLVHRVEVTADGAAPVVLDATVRPGSPTPASVAGGDASTGLLAVLAIEPVSGEPLEAGDMLRFRLEVRAGAGKTLHGVHVRDRPGEAVEPHPGSACLSCHEVGDACDQATERMYAALVSLDRDLRGAAAVLRRAELAGMEVSTPLFELKSQGTTASVEARAFIHTFEPDRLVQRAEEGKKIALSTRKAGEAALAELQYRRKGLAVSLVLVAMVLAAIYLKIRQVDEMRRREGAARHRGSESS